jgi:hypothetical protein
MMTTVGSAEEACHELLLRLAGRLPDDLLWRLRSWLAAAAHTSLASTFPRELLRNRVGLTDDESELLSASAGEWGASRRLLDSILPATAVDSTAVFEPGDGPVDAAALSVLAVVRYHPGVLELRQAWRVGSAVRQRVVLVHGGERPWEITGTAQRLLRAHGDRTPCVEVLPPHEDPSPYHQAAIIGSVSLWSTAAQV